MPDPALSQRAARAMVSRSYTHLDSDDKDAFVEAVGEANSFADLPIKWRQLIVNAENEPQKDPAIYGLPPPPEAGQATSS